MFTLHYMMKKTERTIIVLDGSCKQNPRMETNNVQRG